MNKMRRRPVIAAQLSSTHSPDEMLQPARVRNYLSEIIREAPVDILILGWDEKSALFQSLTSQKERLTGQVFLWYPVLSDYPEFNPRHFVVNINNDKSKGWGGYAGTEINETFRQACPNNPEAVTTSLWHLERLLMKYDFDGVFIDKIRFPSIANGFQDVLSCFCPYCIESAGKAGLDLNEVRRVLEREITGKQPGNLEPVPPGANWLEHFTANDPILRQFINFRVQSINQLVEKTANLAARLNKKMSLDVFSPCLATFVGQDYGSMAKHAAWIKPMIYRFGSGPSSLRSEIPALIHESSTYFKLGLDEVYRRVAPLIEGLQGVELSQVEKTAPLSLIKSEVMQARALLTEAPLYLGLETVRIPGKMEIRPEHVREVLAIGADVGVDGYVLSWDLNHTPLDNIIPLKGLQ